MKTDRERRKRMTMDKGKKEGNEWQQIEK
jgi:hypothetical protein